MTIILNGMNYDYILESDFSDLCMERKGVYLLFRNKRFVLNFLTKRNASKFAMFM